MTHTWDEPAGATPRGTVILLPGRGETATSYQRFGSRLATDAYKVRLVEVDLDDLERTRTEVAKLLVDESLPGPRVLVGSDTGANLAAILVDACPEVDAAVLAGLVVAGSGHHGAGESLFDARSACPVHRRVIAEDEGFDPEALTTVVPAELAVARVPSKPLLVVHGGADVVSEPTAAVAPYLDAPQAWVRLVVGGRHDILNDVSHRSVAATLVLFLESLRLGSDLPPVLVPGSVSEGEAPAAPLERSA